VRHIHNNQNFVVTALHVTFVYDCLTFQSMAFGYYTLCFNNITCLLGGSNSNNNNTRNHNHCHKNHNDETCGRAAVLVCLLTACENQPRERKATSLFSL